MYTYPLSLEGSIALIKKNEDELSERDEIIFSFVKKLVKKDHRTLLSFKGAMIYDRCRLHHIGLRHCHSFFSFKGATIARTKKKGSFSMLLE
jgi:hypothetical protein